MEQLTVDQSEFTITETISKMALLSGLLMDKDENVENCESENNCPSVFPSKEMIEKKPENVTDSLSRFLMP